MFGAQTFQICKNFWKSRHGVRYSPGDENAESQKNQQVSGGIFLHACKLWPPHGETHVLHLVMELDMLFCHVEFHDLSPVGGDASNPIKQRVSALGFFLAAIVSLGLGLGGHGSPRH